MADPTSAVTNGQARDDLLRELVAHLRNNRTLLRQEWARRIGEARLLTALTQEEIFSEATSVYDNYVEVLETGSVEALQDYARNLSERIIPRGVETDEVLGIVLLLRDVLARSLFEKYQADFQVLNEVLDAYEPAANRIANTVGVNFVQERERIIRQQQEAIRELSTPVLQVRERLLILPIIGVLDGQRARQLTEQLLRGIRTNRARVVVIDITGVPAIDSTVANHLVQTVDASRLMGASVIITGLSSEIAQTLVTLGVDLSKVNAVGDLQGGIEEAERLLGYEVSRVEAPGAGRPGLIMAVPILKQGPYLIASIQSALTDTDVLQLRDDVMAQVTRHRSRGIIVDVTSLDVMDSFVSRSLRGIAQMTRLRGARTVIVGIQPEVAFAMVQLGMSFEDVHTALDLEEGLALLQEAGDLGPDPADRIAIESDADVVTARQRARALAIELDMPSTDQTLLATAISEIARNITAYAVRGEVLIERVRDGRGREGVRVVARDDGPGIADLEMALTDGYTTGGGLGLGLPGARRLVDDFDIETAPGKGTTVTLVKWTRA